MIQDVIGSVYLLWPLMVIVLIVIFLAGFLLAVSLGGLFAIGFLTTYYLYVYLKKRGFFLSLYEWLQQKNKLVGKSLTTHIQETFVIKGHLNEVPNGPVLYVAHPHGLFSMAPFIHWAAGVTEWPAARKVHIAIHSVFFKIPFVREFCEHFEAIEATDEEIRRVLTSGESVALLTGGIREISATKPGQMKIHLKKRKGFARVAKEIGVPIVPVLTFGENELFPPVSGFWNDWVQTYLKSWLGIAIPFPTWASFKNWFQLLQGPLSSKVVTWIGKPVATNEKTSIETIRKHIFVAFEDLYKEGRPQHYPEEILIV